MAVRLSTMKARIQEASLTWDGEAVDFAFKPNEFTMELADQIAQAGEAEDMNSVTALLAPMVEWWDVLDDEDQRIPPTVENMRRFPLNFLLSLMDSMTKAQVPETEG